MNSWISSQGKRLFDWAGASALRYYVAAGACCADELLHAVACRYDMERFGALPETDPRLCDLLFVTGAINSKAAEELKRVYDLMSDPKYVIALGTCACSGGAFGADKGGLALPGIAEVIPVDVYVAGCPPRPESILDGLIALQEKIRGDVREHDRSKVIQRRDLLDSEEWDLA